MIIKLLLLPFSFLYGIGVFFRNLFYDLGIFHSVKFTIPVISVGNITAGGTGKTPLVEYLVRLYGDSNQVAILSRGYGRKTKGYLEVTDKSLPTECGDEPLQYKKKFPAITVAVCESRRKGIREILKKHPNTEVVLLDDAFQHRAVSPSLSILLLEYDWLMNDDDFLLPSGRMREPYSSRKRADFIVVSKCPDLLSENQKAYLTGQIKPRSHQKIFFSSISYGEPVSFSTNPVSFPREAESVLVTGIANPAPLVQHLLKLQTKFVHTGFPDHHVFTDKDKHNLEAAFGQLKSDKKILLTTEKDTMRIVSSPLKALVEKYPSFYIPIEVKFCGDDEKRLGELVKKQYI